MGWMKERDIGFFFLFLFINWDGCTSRNETLFVISLIQAMNAICNLCMVTVIRMWGSTSLESGKEFWNE